MLTVQQIYDYVRSEAGELDSKRINDTQLLRWINFGQLKVQNDFASVDFKAFTKTAYYSGAYIQQPSDMLRHPNAIIDLLTGTGAKAATAALAVGTTNGTITHTAKNFGTEWNSWDITHTTGASITVTFDWLNKDIAITAIHSSSTVAQVITALNADTTYSAYFTATGTNTTDTIINASVPGTTSGGTGSSWYPADEVTIENWNRNPFNTYKAATTTNPQFVRLNGFIEIRPITIQNVKLEYYYRLADLTATTDTLAVPAEVEELVILEVLRRVYEKIEEAEKLRAIETEYNLKYKQFVEGYGLKRQGEVAEKERLQSADKLN